MKVNSLIAFALGNNNFKIKEIKKPIFEVTINLSIKGRLLGEKRMAFLKETITISILFSKWGTIYLKKGYSTCKLHKTANI